MQPIEIIVIVATVLFVVGVAAWLIVRKKKGKTGCGCDCSSCSSCSACKSQKKEENN